MAKDKSERSEKQIKKEKHSEKNGITKPKKEKKKLKPVDAAVSEVLLTAAQDGDAATAVAAVDSKPHVVAPRPTGALVPFANPLADEKACKKVLKSVRKAGKHKALKRGVKEVVKALRKSPPATPAAAAATPFGVVVLAADISPMDVISHLPVLCEDHGVPYVYVPSRAELGAAGATKRPTSVVLVAREPGRDRRMEKAKARAKAKEEDWMDVDGEEAEKEEKEDDWGETYAEMLKVVRKAGRDVRI